MTEFDVYSVYRCIDVEQGIFETKKQHSNNGKKINRTVISYKVGGE